MRREEGGMSYWSRTRIGKTLISRYFKSTANYFLLNAVKETLMILAVNYSSLYTPKIQVYSAYRVIHRE